MHFESLSQLRDIQARLTLWPMETLSSIHSFCCWFINPMQHSRINGDNYSSIKWGSYGAWIINICMSPFHFLCGALCCYGRRRSAAGQALITHSWESATALLRLLWSAASTQRPDHDVLFMGNNQDLTSERVLKWYLWRGLSSAWKGFWKHTYIKRKKNTLKILRKTIQVVTFYHVVIKSQEKRQVLTL